MQILNDLKINGESVYLFTSTEQALIQNKGYSDVYISAVDNSGLPIITTGIRIKEGESLIFPGPGKLYAYSTGTAVLALALGNFDDNDNIPLVSFDYEYPAVAVLGQKNTSPNLTFHPSNADIDDINFVGNIVSVDDNFDYVFDKTGDSTVTITVTDKDGNSASKTKTGTVSELKNNLTNYPIHVEQTVMVAKANVTPSITPETSVWSTTTPELIKLNSNNTDLMITAVGVAVGDANLTNTITYKGVSKSETKTFKVIAKGTMPSFTAQPASQVLYQEDGTLSIDAISVAGTELQLQWQRKPVGSNVWQNYGNVQTETRLLVQNAKNMDGTYRLRASNYLGSVYTNEVDVVSVYLRIQNDAAQTGTNSVDKLTNKTYALNSGPGTRYLSAFYNKFTDDSPFIPYGLSSGRSVSTWSTTNAAVAPNTPVSAGGQLTSTVKTGTATLTASIGYLSSTLACNIT